MGFCRNPLQTSSDLVVPKRPPTMMSSRRVCFAPSPEFILVPRVLSGGESKEEEENPKEDPSEGHDEVVDNAADFRWRDDGIVPSLAGLSPRNVAIASSISKLVASVMTDPLELCMTFSPNCYEWKISAEYLLAAASCYCLGDSHV
ncbi:hypothetical protein RIF29_04571 [Crotalaria pallida]|uniref:Uncharacterized protein n=1 Tax=Crotalaria pallida TaxID=3830 RepID=A0AAN9J1C9_CROPI